MPMAVFHFHSELNDFLPKEKQRLDINVAFKRHETVKHLLELHDEDDNALIMHIVKNYNKIESPKHHMLVWNLMNMLLVCSQF